MKNSLLSAFCFFLLLAAITSCKKEDTVPQEESPFFVFFDQPAIAIDTTPVAATNWEYGFVFNPLVAGKITKLGIKLPVAGTFKVRLWDLSGSNPAILSEQNVRADAIHTPAFIGISPVAVQKNATLGVTILANSFYRIEKQDASGFTFPQVVNNIRIVSFNEETNDMSLAMFPQTKNETRVAPCVNVVFVAD